MQTLCSHCKKPLLGQGQKLKGKLYHVECIEAMKQSARKKDAAKANQLNDPDLKALADYLCGVFQLSLLTPLLQKQISDFHVTYSYRDLLIAAKYFFECGQGATQTQEFVSIGILPYVMQEAKEFAATLEAAAKASANTGKTTTVRVRRPDSSIPSSTPMESI